MHLVGFIIRICHDAGHMNEKNKNNLNQCYAKICRFVTVCFILVLGQFKDKTLVLPRLGTSAGYFREPVVWSYTKQMESDLCTGHAAYRYLTGTTCGTGSSVGIATGYGLDGPGIESLWGRDFPHLSRPSLWPTQPPVQWVPGLSRGVKRGRGVTLTPRPLLVPWS